MIQPENMCDIVFEKTKGHGGTVNRTINYEEAASQIVLYIKSIMIKKTRKEKQENTCDAVDLQLYLKRDSSTGAFLWILRNF